ncbi:MipA/OmpV family protein [Fusobacterium ulcerans]|jgi:outer membrane protein|uniref:Outer membrane protein n=1 Tax=Fusobacterium ulcerans 12-1B TaxID=457404 RepID=H1PSU6_9FUSO|nr:MipA/OmpV family protein [Fusobacterium ulcerans]EHO81825.1 hypothetical protein HMPREF0402_01489 [Fusobacterium ulcerans 12-1B]
MKKMITLLSTFILCSSLSLAQSELQVKALVQNKNKFQIGGAVGVTNHFFKGDSLTYPIPVFDVRYDDFYIAGVTMGYDMYSEDDFTLSLFVNPFDGFPIKGSKLDRGYRSIDDRKPQVAVGMLLSYNLNFYDMTAVVAFSGGERGIKGTTRIIKPYRVTDNFALIPSFGATIYSSNYVDYYFGIDSNEVKDKITDTYSPDTAYSLGLSLAAEYYLNDKITLLAFLSADRFSSDIGDSPIIDSNKLIMVGAGVKYSF